MKKVAFLCALVSLFALDLASPAHAGPGLRRPGIRLGITGDPDTGFGGLFYDVPISRIGSTLLMIRPGFDVGADGDLDTITLRGNLDFLFHFRLGRRSTIYPLVGPSLYYLDCGENCDSTNFGLNLGGGFAFDRFNFDLIVGVADLPDVTFAFGFLF